MTDHSSYRYSAVVQSDDLAIVNCLRALSQYSQRSGNNRIPWGGTKDSDWERDGRRVTFRFTSEEYRCGFLAQIERLLPSNLLKIIDTSDDDSATPQS